MNLDEKVSKIPKIGPYYQSKLQKLSISTIEELIKHVPARYLDFTTETKINRVRAGEVVSVSGTVDSIKNQYTKSGKFMQFASISDETKDIPAIWFNQPFLARTLRPGTKVNLAGKADFFGNKLALISPEYEIIFNENSPLHTKGLVPVYPSTAGISSKWLRSKIKLTLDLIAPPEVFSDQILKRLKVPNLPNALKMVHFPQTLTEAEEGRKRLAFEELLFLHLQSLERKKIWIKNKKAPELKVDKSALQKFINSLPFILTTAQTKVIKEILNDLGKSIPMNRLLQGDVGSGKTIVAGIAALINFLNGYQTIIMAPTQILAQQHYQTLTHIFSKFKVRLSLITSDVKSQDAGSIDVFVGTHALLSKKNSKEIYKNVGLVVIDEQHRFGVKQRMALEELSKKKIAPHVLTMTATPIPRTIALTFYGDLDLSILDEMPESRQKTTTWVVPPVKRAGAYSWISQQIKKNKSQAFIVCPLIEESEVETMKAVKSAKKEYEELKNVFPDLNLDLLHGKLTSEEKTKVLKKFKEGSTDILVATPVVEVGIDIPNATIMLIEAAERFGLAQLHQLRGRVGRGEKKSYCLLFTESQSREILERLTAMEKTHSGFELSELDLKLRGPGEIFGVRQHGLPELKIANWQDIDLIKQTRSLAEEIMGNPEKYKKLSNVIKSKLHPN